MMRLLIGLFFVNSGNVVEIVDVRDDPPMVTVVLRKVPDEGAIGEEGWTWEADWAEFTAGWNPLE